MPGEKEKKKKMKILFSEIETVLLESKIKNKSENIVN